MIRLRGLSCSLNITLNIDPAPLTAECLLVIYNRMVGGNLTLLFCSVLKKRKGRGWPLAESLCYADIFSVLFIQLKASAGFGRNN